MTDGGFSAFPAETLQFLSGIADNNSKDWFEANRDLYEAGYVAPGREFVETLGPRLKKVSPTVRYEPKINGSIARINRDVRFSRDKRPYKDHLDLWFWHGEKRGWDRPGFFLRITPERLFLGTGMHQFEGKMLDDFRAAVLAERSGEALMKAIDEVKASGPYEIGGATRKTTPRGFDANHERAGLLLHEGLHAGLELPVAEAFKDRFADRALAHFAATWPIGQWLLEEVAAG
jgi:uncharacterized protein (TIGR02453 family)